TLLRFDVAALAGMTVVSALLRLWSTNSSTAYSGDLFEAHQALESWSEATATWNQRTAGTPWSNVGADTPNSSASLVAGSSNAASHLLSASFAAGIGRALVLGWVNGTIQDFGIVIVNGTGDDGANCVSREGADGRRTSLQ